MTTHRITMPGRDTCAGTCETEAGCTCCLSGCEGRCSQGRLSCHGRPLPMGRTTAWLVRNPENWGYILGAITCGLVLLCVVADSFLAGNFR